METIVSALITGALAFLGVVVSSLTTAGRVQAQLEKAQAVTETRLEDLAREVRTHNNFARRMPVVEEQIKVLHHRMEDLEAYHKSH